MKIDKRRYWGIVGTVCINDTPASSADAISGQLSIQDHRHVCSKILPRIAKSSKNQHNTSILKPFDCNL